MKINEKIYESLMKCEWLKTCGTSQDFDFDFEVFRIENRDEMVKNITSTKWENVCLEEQGNLTAFLCINRRGEYRQWNAQINVIKKEYLSTVLLEISSVLNRKNYPDEVFADISFNLVSILMSDFYAKYYNSNFYTNILKVYLSGHLPCGWAGEYPDGKVMVF